MKLKRLTSGIWAFAFSFGLSFSATMCIVSAFHMGVDTWLLLRICLLAAFLCSFCYILPLGLLPPGIIAAAVAQLWQNGFLEAALEAFLNRLSRQYNRAYKWGIIRWSYRVADEMEPDIVIILCILGALIAMLCAWSISRRKTAAPALLFSLLVVSTCFLVDDTVPALHWLFLYLLCFTVPLLTGIVRRQDEKQGNRLCLWLTPITAAAFLVLFFCIPQKGYSGKEAPRKLIDTLFPRKTLEALLESQKPQVTTTNTEIVDLRSVGYRVVAHSPLLEVTAPFDGTIYLRSRAMDIYDGTSWRASNDHLTVLPWPKEPLVPAGALTITTRFAHRMLYMPYYASITETQAIPYGIENENTLTEYSFSCRTLEDPGYFSKLYPSPDTPWAVPQEELTPYISLDSAVSEWATQTAKTVCGDLVSPYHQAQAIGAYVRNSASYNTRTQKMPSKNKDFAKWFLQESETGYCIHFATTATVLLQAAGIPARYVTGYYTQVTKGEAVTVYTDQAHAWAEYWLPGYGWTVLEATPAAFSEDPQETTVPTTVPETEPTVPSTLPATETTAPAATVPFSKNEPTQNNRNDLIFWVLLGIAGLCLLATAAELQRRLRLRQHRRQRSMAQPNQRALLYWQDTVLYAKLLKGKPDKALLVLAERAKFSQHTLTESQLMQFETANEGSLSQLKQQNLLRRLYYRYILALY